MEGSRGRWWWWGGRRRSMLMVVLALCIALAVVALCCCARSGACSASGCSGRSTVAVLRSDFGRRTAASWGNQERSRASGSGSGRRRRLLVVAGPGSYPPRCTSKCGSCNPCYPVHVAVPPGVPVTTEYYPEAWRCRCGNRLYMP